MTRERSPEEPSPGTGQPPDTEGPGGEGAHAQGSPRPPVIPLPRSKRLKARVRNLGLSADVGAAGLRERKFKVLAILVALALAEKVAQVFVTDERSAANVLVEGGALLVLLGWWRFAMQRPEERRDLSALWAWARFGVVLLAAGVVAGLIQAITG